MTTVHSTHQEQQSSLRNTTSTPQSKTSSHLTWWYRLSAPENIAESANFNTREQYRRGRIASLLILGTLCAAILLTPIIILAAPGAFHLSWVIISTTAGISCCLLAIPMNRLRYVPLVAILLIVAVDIIVAGIILGERDGLDPILLSMFDLLVVSELIAASLLAPGSVFIVAAINMLLIVMDINFQPHSMMWMQMVMSEQFAYSLIARPITLYLVVAAVAYLWVRSALTALQRADRAELIAELERREAEQKKQLEREIERILMVHVRVANGDLNARAPTSQDHALWQIGLALNNLLARFKNAARAEYSLQRITGDIAQLRIALRHWQSGQRLQWRPSTEMALNRLIDDIRRALVVQSESKALQGQSLQHHPHLRQHGVRAFTPETPLPEVNPFFTYHPETPS